MKILILGAKGMLGQALAEECRKNNFETVCWDRNDCDIADEKAVKLKIQNLKPEIIINTAAYNNVDKTENEDRDLAMKINGEAVGYLVEASANIGAVFIHYSSDYVFDGNKQEGYKEDDEPEPQSWYAKTKYEGEQKISNLKFYLVRTSRLFGPAGTGEGAKKSFVDKMLELGKKNCHSREGGNLDVIDEEVSSPTYVKDLARATIELIESKAPWGIYHRTNSGSCTWYGWAKKIFELANLPVQLNPVPASKFPRPAIRPKYSVLLNTKLPAMRDWEEALAEYLGF